jgi:hypothetical protein
MEILWSTGTAARLLCLSDTAYSTSDGDLSSSVSVMQVLVGDARPGEMADRGATGVRLMGGPGAGDVLRFGRGGGGAVYVELRSSLSSVVSISRLLNLESWLSCSIMELTILVDLSGWA